MEGGVLLSASCVGGFCCAAGVGASVCQGLSRAYSAAVAGASTSKEETGINRRDAAALLLRHYVRNGVPSCSELACFATKGRRLGKVASEAAGLLRRRGWDATAESVMSLCVAACIAAAAVSAVVFKSLASAILMPVCFAAAAALAVSQGGAKERERIRDQVPDALRCMEACLHAGLSLPQAFAEVAHEVDQPLRESFVQVTRDIELGFPMHEALARFHRNAGIEELGFVAMALDVQYSCGGNATPVLHAAEDSIVRGLDLRRSLRVQTAQARLSAQMVGVLPLFLLAVLSAVSPGFLESFFADARGMALLAMAACMQAAGVLLIRKMLSVAL